MTVVGLDDTDSRAGMCSTYVAALTAGRLRERGARVDELLLVRLNPAVAHKTRGNAALAIHTDADPDAALAVASEVVAAEAETDAPDTNPAVVVADHGPAEAPEPVVEWARAAVRDHHDIDDALALVEASGYAHAGWGNARGTIGALAAVGARAAFDDWTYERIAYRERGRWGSPRAVDEESLFAAADDAYPAAWDTVDRGEGSAVAVPRTPCPVLFGIRGDDPDAVAAVADRVEGEPVDRAATFLTNQGTDAHLRDADLGAVEDCRSYRVDGVVASPPETRRGGHVFFELAEPGSETGAAGAGAVAGDRVAEGGDGDLAADGRADDRVADGGDADATLRCAAFEPTKRFRDRVRALRPGDRITACGEVTDGTLKLEKFAVRSLVRTERVTPTCPDCGRTMESAGADQGYRCRDCGTAAPGRVERPVDRDLEAGWYEVPPVARRHVAKPLVRGGFDAPVHPER